MSVPWLVHVWAFILATVKFGHPTAVVSAPSAAENVFCLGPRAGTSRYATSWLTLPGLDTRKTKHRVTVSELSFLEMPRVPEQPLGLGTKHSRTVQGVQDVASAAMALGLVFKAGHHHTLHVDIACDVRALSVTQSLSRLASELMDDAIVGVCGSGQEYVTQNVAIIDADNGAAHFVASADDDTIVVLIPYGTSECVGWLWRATDEEEDRPAADEAEDRAAAAAVRLGPFFFDLKQCRGPRAVTFLAAGETAPGLVYALEVDSCAVLQNGQRGFVYFDRKGSGGGCVAVATLKLKVKILTRQGSRTSASPAPHRATPTKRCRTHATATLAALAAEFVEPEFTLATVAEVGAPNSGGSLVTSVGQAKEDSSDDELLQQCKPSSM
jgi:hypothetical protein